MRRIAPKPRRLTTREPPSAKAPAAAALELDPGPSYLSLPSVPDRFYSPNPYAAA